MWFLDPVSLFKGIFGLLFGETLTEEIDKNPDLASIAGPWDSAMDTLGEYADYGSPDEQNLQYVPYGNGVWDYIFCKMIINIL